VHRRLSGCASFPYTTLFRSMPELQELDLGQLYDNAQDISEKAREVFPRMDQDRLWLICVMLPRICSGTLRLAMNMDEPKAAMMRSEEHTSELQSRENLVCRL